MRKAIAMYDLNGPQLIAVNPLSGWMYWTGNGGGCIERAGLDGSNRNVVIGKKLSHCQGLVLDFVENRLFWSQKSSFHSIWSSNFDGSDQKLVFETTDPDLSQCFYRPIGVFDNSFYFMMSWSAWSSNQVYKVNKCNGQGLEKVYNPRFRLWDLKVYHATLQPEGKNFCLKRINQCSHFCLPAPSSGSDGSVSTTTCACPDGLALSSDQQNCIKENYVDAIYISDRGYVIRRESLKNQQTKQTRTR